MERLMTVRTLSSPLVMALVIAVAASSPGGPRASRTTPVSIDTRQGTMLAFDISPDGRTIAFDLLGQIWLLPIEGGDALALTDAVGDTAEDLNPAFAPDGTRLVFQADRPGGTGLWLLSIMNRAVRRLTTGPDNAPAWSPDGQRVAFIRDNAVLICDIVACTPRPIAITGMTAAGLRDPAWTVDGRRLRFVNGASGGRLWEVAVEGGAAQPLGDAADRALAPAVGRDGLFAFFLRDADRRAQLWVRDSREAAPRRLTDHADTTPTRVRWLPGGDRLVYAANGGLWSIALSGGAPRQIPFRARLRFNRSPAVTRPIQIDRSGITRTARGHMGVELSPDGRQIAMIALGKLWVIPAGAGTPQAIAPMPDEAAGLSWSPDGRQVVWSSGPGGAEDLFATEVATGHTRQITSIPGGETRPSWSPDGKWIAFLHWRKPVSGTPPSEIGDTSLRLHVVASDSHSERLEQTRSLGDVPLDWSFRAFGLSQETPQWSPDSSALLVISASRQASLISLAGSRRAVVVPTRMTFVRWTPDGSLVFVQDNSLWRVPMSSDGEARSEPTPVVDAMCLYPSVAHTGDILCISPDGLTVHTRSRPPRRLQWPLTFTSPVPPSMLLHGGRVIDGLGSTASGPKDVLLERGRVQRIAPAGSIVPPRDTPVIDVSGTVLIPGLIELHGHLWDDAVPRGLLYYGITTMRDLGAPVARVAALRDAIEAGIRVGPRIVFGAFQIWGHTGASGETGQSPSDERSRKRVIAFLGGIDASWTKIRQFADWDTIAATIRASHDAGLRVTGHIAVPLPLVAAGMDGAEHLGASSGPRAGEIIYDDIVQLFKSAGMWVVPTISAYSGVTDVLTNPSILDAADTAPWMSPFLRWWALRLPATSGPAYARFATFARRSTTKLHEAGVRIAAGSDDPTVAWALHRELEALVAAGLTPIEAIRAATSVSAAILGASGQLGVIAPGAVADIVVLDDDPLADIRNTRRIRMVIKGGVVSRRAGGSP